MIFSLLVEIDRFNPGSPTQKFYRAKGEGLDAKGPGWEVVRECFMAICNPLFDEVSQSHQRIVAIVSIVCR